MRQSPPQCSWAIPHAHLRFSIWRTLGSTPSSVRLREALRMPPTSGYRTAHFKIRIRAAQDYRSSFTLTVHMEHSEACRWASTLTALPQSMVEELLSVSDGVALPIAETCFTRDVPCLSFQVQECDCKSREGLPAQ